MESNSDALVSTRLHSRERKLAFLDNLILSQVNTIDVRNRGHKLLGDIYPLNVLDYTLAVSVIYFVKDIANSHARRRMLDLVNLGIQRNLQVLQATLVCLLVGDHGIVDINIDLLWPGVENLESTQFYELCQKYSDIALNAIKQRIPGTCDVQGCFQFADIEIAKRATKDYVVDREIEDVDTLLSLIHEFHSHAVAWDDKRTTSGRVLPENYNYQSIYGGQYFNFKELPEDIWGDIATEVKEYICG